jgi:hypothetical protein
MTPTVNGFLGDVERGFFARVDSIASIIGWRQKHCGKGIKSEYAPGNHSKGPLAIRDPVN